MLRSRPRLADRGVLRPRVGLLDQRVHPAHQQVVEVLHRQRVRRDRPDARRNRGMQQVREARLLALDVPARQVCPDPPDAAVDVEPDAAGADGSVRVVEADGSDAADGQPVVAVAFRSTASSTSRSRYSHAFPRPDSP